MPSNETFHAGPCTMMFEPPDIAVVVIAGIVDHVIANQLIDRLVSWSRDKPYVLVVVNVSKLISLSRDARKVLTSNGHRLPRRVLSLYGGSFAMQVVFDLMDRASWLLGSRNRLTKHWPDEKSARSWAEDMRPILCAKELDPVKPR